MAWMYLCRYGFLHLLVLFHSRCVGLKSLYITFYLSKFLWDFDEIWNVTSHVKDAFDRVDCFESPPARPQFA